VTELAWRFAAGEGAWALALFAPDIRIERPSSPASSTLLGDPP
jgi:hypothetical protein